MARSLKMITAKDNELIKDTAKLMSSAKHRREKDCFVAEGVRLCVDGVLSGAQITHFLYTNTAQKKYPEEFARVSAYAKKTVEISEALFKKLSDTTAPQGFLCIVKRLDKSIGSFTISNQGRYAALENIQDPQNLGTILRTAEALGTDGVILSSDCCDIYSPKVIRGSMGAVFRVPIMIAEQFTDFIRTVTKQGIPTFASTPHEADDLHTVDFSKGGIMLIGNEGNGLKQETIGACRQSVRINMKGRAESLNAAAAAAILLYALQG